MIRRRPPRLEGRVAAVTGGGRGIGAVIAEHLAHEGADVVLLDILDDTDAAAHRLMRQTGRISCAVHCDVTDESDVEQAFTTAEGHVGPVDILVNSAGIAHNVAADQMTSAQWRRVIDVNLTGTFLTSTRCARRLIELQRPGSIVNIASMSAHVVNVPQPQAAYNAAKAGVSMLTKSLAVEWIRHRIRVNAVSPGYVVTAMTQEALDREPGKQAEWLNHTPLGRFGRPEDIAPVVAFLASDDAGFIVGQDIVADGGYTLV